MNQSMGLLHQVMRCAGVAMVRNEADFVVPLDADELLATDRAGLDQALRAVPEGFVGAMRWRTYLPEGVEADPYFFRRMTAYRSSESKEQVKVIAPSHLLANHYYKYWRAPFQMRPACCVVMKLVPSV